jgi:hypothetical protein
LSRKQELQPLITGQLPCETPEGRASASTTRRKSMEAHGFSRGRMSHVNCTYSLSLALIPPLKGVGFSARIV